MPTLHMMAAQYDFRIRCNLNWPLKMSPGLCDVCRHPPLRSRPCLCSVLILVEARPNNKATLTITSCSMLASEKFETSNNGCVPRKAGRGASQTVRLEVHSPIMHLTVHPSITVHKSAAIARLRVRSVNY